MIDALDLALSRLLDDASAPAGVRDAAVSFEPLERSYRPTEPTVNLFLCAVSQDLDLRDPVPSRVRTADGFIEEPAPIRVDCRYLVTTWATNGASPAQQVADEHRLLAEVMAWLGGFPVLPASTLGPRLSNQPVPIRLTAGHPHPERELVDLWSALGVAPRAAIWLSAVLALSTGAASALGAPVTDVNVALTLEGQQIVRAHRHLVGGRVRNAEAPLATAMVSIGDFGRRVDTDSAGVFRLGSIPEGTYQLEVAAPGHLTATRTVHVPPVAGDEYDVELDPEP